MKPDYDAVWQFEKEEENPVHAERSSSDVYAFVYENDSVIIILPSEAAVAGLPEDGIYRVKTKWKGNELYIFAPLGDRWELFAAWENGRFVMYGDGKVKIFKKIGPEEIAVWQKGLLTPGREMWSYPYLDPDKVEIQ